MIKLYSVKVGLCLLRSTLNKPGIQQQVPSIPCSNRVTLFEYLYFYDIEYRMQEKQKKQAEQAAQGQGTTQSPGELRAQKDLSELDLPKGGMLQFPVGKDKVMNFEFVLVPYEGMYRD